MARGSENQNPTHSLEITEEEFGELLNTGIVIDTEILGEQEIDNGQINVINIHQGSVKPPEKTDNLLSEDSRKQYRRKSRHSELRTQLAFAIYETMMPRPGVDLNGLIDSFVNAITERCEGDFPSQRYAEQDETAHLNGISFLERHWQTLIMQGVPKEVIWQSDPDLKRAVTQNVGDRKKRGVAISVEQICPSFESTFTEVARGLHLTSLDIPTAKALGYRQGAKLLKKESDHEASSHGGSPNPNL